VATHKFLPGRPVALEALLDQLGILLQRIFSLINLLRCKACLRVGFSLISRLAVHLGLPTMERKMLPKCSPRDQPLTPDRSARILLTVPPRDKRINQVEAIRARIAKRSS